MFAIVIGACSAFVGHTMADAGAHIEKLMGKAFMPAVGVPQVVGHMSMHPAVTVLLPSALPVMSDPDESISHLQNEVFKLEATNHRMEAELERFHFRMAIMKERRSSRVKFVDVQYGRDMILGFGSLGVALLFSMIYRVFFVVNVRQRDRVISVKPLEGELMQTSSAGCRTAGAVMREGKRFHGAETSRDPEPVEERNCSVDGQVSMSANRATDHASTMPTKAHLAAKSSVLQPNQSLPTWSLSTPTLQQVQVIPSSDCRSVEVSNELFFSEVSSWLRREGFRCRCFHKHEAGRLIVVRGSRAGTSSVVLNLLPTPRCTADVLPAVGKSSTAMLTKAFAARRQQIVHLWEDQWAEHSLIVRSRLLAKLGRSTRIMARKTIARRIDAATIDPFLLENHLWGSTKARYRYGLFEKKTDTLVAVASFSARWKLRRNGNEARASHELIRYCSRHNEAVTGGISKLMKAFQRDAAPDDIVTVIDRDWSDGSGWHSLGFRPLKQLSPVSFYIGPDGRRCHLGGGPNPYRRRLPPDLAVAVEGLTSPEEIQRFLASYRYFPVHDVGAERLLLDITEPATSSNS